ncbi:hypothetical protein Nepgr_007325 [Nepenthes gracilis]|uniref:GDSL esterase/lipase n=1 Tax=Nepenthes gracilis TaxID=150966 RepID=A0AAD3S6R5_NEPGR|nr:hypothetical protein Nepgr_007325 [Nepenthes gracilis]
MQNMLSPKFLLPFFLLSVTHGVGYVSSTEQHKSSALFVFGDSTVDPGNNNYFHTLDRSNFPPYGTDFPNHIPTGRFSNGRLATDFIAAYLGIKDFVPPYLDPTLGLEELITGVSFASAGSGYDPRTSSTNGASDVWRQLRYFEEYKTRLERLIGKKRTQDTIVKAIFVVSAGTNDLSGNFALPSPTHTTTVSTYQHLLLNYCRRFIQGLVEQGARKIAIVNVPPIGCVPSIITVNSALSIPVLQHRRRPCIDSLSSIARQYNQMLQAELKALQSSFKENCTLAYADIYTPLDGYIRRPYEYGFEVVDRGCCGSGLLEQSYSCNPFSLVCHERSKYVFWDATHPTETAYNLLFQALRPVIDYLVNN